MAQLSVSLISASSKPGSTDTVFTAVATLSYNDQNFKFFFHVRAGSDSEVFVDECSGERQVPFRLPVESQYGEGADGFESNLTGQSTLQKKKTIVQNRSHRRSSCVSSKMLVCGKFVG